MLVCSTVQASDIEGKFFSLPYTYRIDVYDEYSLRVEPCDAKSLAIQIDRKSLHVILNHFFCSTIAYSGCFAFPRSFISFSTFASHFSSVSNSAVISEIIHTAS